MPPFEDRPTSARSSPPTVLLVEDEPTPRAEISRMVRGLGYQIRTSRDGREALRYLQQHPGEIRLVLSDVIMPYMDGGELAERVRDLLPGVRIVLMSESLEGPAGELVAAYPEIPFLAKPFSFAELYATLSWLIGPPGVPTGPRPGKPAYHRDRETQG
jgi:two-component system, cell cycle sensor histidine kinase and response regulator CckA